MSVTLDEKLQAFDREAHLALNAIVARLGDDIVSLARKRHIEGHELYGDGGLFEYDGARLARERDEEIADAVVYEVRRRCLARLSRL